MPCEVFSRWPAAALSVILAVALSVGPAPDARHALADGGSESTVPLASGEAASATPSAQPSPTGESRYTSVRKVVLNKKNVRIKNDGKFRFRATLALADASKGLASGDAKITWSISNRKIASITQKGVVKGKKSGTAVVTARSANGKTAKAKVEVVIDQGKMAQAVPILAYHRISADVAKPLYVDSSTLVVSASMFKAQMRWLKNNGYRTISTDQFREWRVNGTFLRKKSVMVTIDDGYYETYHVAYPILKKLKQKAVSFVIGARVKKKTAAYDPHDTKNHYMGRDVIDKVRKKYPNLEFQSHTYNMHYRAANGNGIATTLSRAKLKADCKKNYEKFGFSSIAYPFGHTSSTLIACVRADKTLKMGFGYPMNNPATRKSARYNIPRMKVSGNGSLRDFISLVSTCR